MRLYRILLVPCFLLVIILFQMNGCQFFRNSSAPTVNFQVISSTPVPMPSPTPTLSPSRLMAQVYGVDRFDGVHTIKFTFHSRMDDKTIQRRWRWRIDKQEVTYQGPNSDGELIEHTYGRQRLEDLDPELNKKIDQWFVNDQYWLLFPFHLVWDEELTISEDGDQPLPISFETTKRLTITYGPNQGYTPGDVYEVYFGPDMLVKEWVYRKQGSPTPTCVTTWEDHIQIGPLLISMNHKSQDDKWRVWFTDVSVALKSPKK